MTKIIQKTLACLLILMYANKVNAQLSGSYAVPGTYTSIAAVVSALNTSGVSGAVTINIAAGYTETAPVGGFVLNAITGASSVNQITFQKSGVGVNPLITAFTGTAIPSSAVQDGVWWFIGADFITMDGIDIIDPNTSNPATMEFGYGFYKASATDGCQNNTIKNCVITLNRVNNAAGAGSAVDGSRGIDVMNATSLTNTVALTVTAATGANSNNKFYSNTIQNCNIGIALIGFAAATPFTLADTGNDIGGTVSSTGNAIINFGGGGITSAAAGIRTLAQYGINISNNTVNNNTGSGVNHAVVIRGIYLNTASGANMTVNNNTLTIKNNGTITQVSIIEAVSGGAINNNTISITNNLITNCTSTLNTTGVFYGIWNSNPTSNLIITGNTFTNNTSNATTGASYFIYNNAAVPGIINMSNNTLSNISFNNTITAYSGVMYNVYNSSGATTSTLTMANNSFSNYNFSNVTGTGSTYFVYNGASCFVTTLANNTFNNLQWNNSGGVYLVYNSTSTQKALSVTNNSIITGFTRLGASGTFYGYYSGASSLGTSTQLFSGNNFSNITSTVSGSGGFYGIYSSDGSASPYPQKTIFNNVISNNTINTTGTSYGLFVNYLGDGSLTTGSSVFSNTVSNQTFAGALYGLYINSTASPTYTPSIYSNIVNNLNSSGASSSIYGAFVAGPTLGINFYKNKISGISETGATGIAYGLYVSSGTNSRYYNNLIGSVNTPSSTGANRASGIYIAGGTSINLFNNSVYLTGTSSGANFGSNAFYSSTTPSLVLMNNIFVNNCTPTGTEFAVAYRRSSTTLTTYSTSSNNNLFYAGNPGTNNLIYYDGTNLVQGISPYKVLMSTRDALSVTENPTFISTVGTNTNFLNINTTVPTQIESGAVPVSGITDDFAGTSRNVSTPDIGAWEGAYTPIPPCTGAPAASNLVSTQAAVCPSVSFNISSSTTYSNPGITYQWLASTTSSSTGFAAIANGTLSTLSYTDLPATTWYQLAITCTNSSLDYTTAAIPVVLGVPNLNSIASTTFMCTSQSVNLSLSSPVSGALYQWGTSSTSSATGYVAITNATLATRSTTGVVGANWYAAVISCSANPSYSLASNPVSVNVGAIPTATALASSSTICASSNLTLAGNSDVANVYSWRGPSSFTSTAQNPVFTNGSSGVYTLVTSLNTCSSTAATVSVTINGKLFLSTPVASPSSICIGGSSQLRVADYAAAKVNAYGFSTTTGVSLVPMSTGSISVLGISNDDTPMATPAAIGFTFNYNGTDYTQFTASPDGWVMLGAQVGSNEFTNVITSTSNIPKLYPYWDDLATGTNGYVRTQLFGTAPTRTLVIEWYVTIPRNTTGAANSTFQALLHESSGNVEFRYGALGIDASGLSSSGLTGDATTFNCLTFTSTSNSTVTANDANAVQPALGTSYLFTPPSVSYSWTSSANLSSTIGSVVSSTPTTSSIYNIGVNNAGCITTRTLAVAVSTPPVINIVASSTAICPGATATLTASGAATYSWNSGSTNTVLAVSPTASLTTYTVQGFSGACSSTQTISVNVPGNPTVSILGSTGICTGQTATLTANGASTYSWNTGATTNSITDVPVTNTTYTVTGTDALGCKTSTTQLVTVATSLSITIAGPSTLCVGQTVTLTGSGGVTYVWNGGATTNTLAINPVTNTSYSVVGSSGTCSNSAVLNVTVNANPTVAVTGNSVICAGNSTTLTASGAATYSWNTSATSTLITVSPLTNTSYTVRGFSAVGCSAIATVAVVSNTLPVLTIVPSATGACVNSTATLTASGANTYSWVSGPVNSVNTVTVLANTIYTVSGTNAANCVASKTVALTSYSLSIINIAPASSTVCSMSVANFTASGAASYSWSSPSFTGATVSYTPVSSAVYTVTGINSQNCISSNTVAVTTKTLPVINITPPSVTVCALSLVNFTATGASSYLWNNSNSGSTFVSASANGVTNTVVGVSSQGCSSSATVGVVNLPLPTLSISPSFTTLCISSTGIFTVSGASSYTWENTSNATTVAITPTTSISYSVVGTGTNGCSNSASAVILTQTLPVVGITPASATVCPNTAQSFTASGALTYTWSSGGNTAATSVTAAATTVYSVSGENANGCVAVKTVTVNTLAAPNVIVTPPSASVCLNSATSFTASGAQSYIWNTGDNSAVLNPATTTSAFYTVTGTNALGCKASTTVNLFVWQLPVINISASSTTICAKEMVTLTASGASTYTWFPFNVSGTTLTNTPVNTLTYIVYGDDVNGCSNTNSISIYVDKCTGIEKNKVTENAIRLYPNPSLGVVNVDFGFEGKKQIIISNSTGALVGQMTTESLSEIINLSEKAKGVYFIKVISNGTNSNFRMVIE